MRTVFKYLPTPGRYGYDLPRSAMVLHVAAQDPSDSFPSVWAEVESTDTDRDQTLFIVGTGHEVPDNVDHLGSAVCLNGTLVWHVYRLRT